MTWFGGLTDSQRNKNNGSNDKPSGCLIIANVLEVKQKPGEVENTGSIKESMWQNRKQGYGYQRMGRGRQR